MRASVAVLARGLAMVVLVGGTAAWLEGDREVRLTVDGESRTVHTRAGDVRGLLSRAGVEVAEHDAVAPGLDADVTDGTEVRVDRGRLLTLTVDGRTREVWVTARSVDEALREVGVRARRVRLSASRSGRVPLGGLALDVRTEKQVTVTADGRTAAAPTFAGTVGDLLAERGLAVGSRDTVAPAVDRPLVDGTRVTVRRVRVRTVTATVVTRAPEQRRSDAALMKDQQRVVAPGRAGRTTRTVEHTYMDGRLTGTRVVATRVVAAPAPRVVAVGTKAYPSDGSGLNWPALARCESGGNPRAVSGGGSYHGLYQFSVSTWARVGGSGLPSLATPQEQTYRAQLLYRRAGAGQWPTCGSRLFT